MNVQCYNCDGTGKIGPPPDLPQGHVYAHTCPKCGGEGELDWIENAMGGKNYHGSTSSTTGSGGASCSSCPSREDFIKASKIKKLNFFKKKEYFQRRKSIYKINMRSS